MKDNQKGETFMKLYSNTITIEQKNGSEAELQCRSCQTVLCNESQEWKEHVNLDERPIAEVAGDAYSSTDPNLLLRQFSCPGCGGLLDSEVALKGEAYLKDRVWS